VLRITTCVGSILLLWGLWVALSIHHRLSLMIIWHVVLLRYLSWSFIWSNHISWLGRISIVCCQCVLQCCNKLELLFFNIFFVGIANKIYIFPYFSIFAIFWGIERLFFIKIIKSFTVYRRLKLWFIRWTFLSNIGPVYTLKELVLLNLLYSITTKSVFFVTH